MPIVLNCTCGKMLRVADENTGKRVKCPACNAVIAPPAPEPHFQVMEDEPKNAPTSKAAAKPDENDDDGGDYGMKPATNTPDKPKKKPRFRRRADADDYEDDHPTARRRSRGSSTISSDAGRRIVYIVGGVLLTVLGIGLAGARGSVRGLIFGASIAIGGMVMVGQGLTGNMPGSD